MMNLDSFLIFERVGEGASAWVYRANTALGQRFALKVAKNNHEETILHEARQALFLHIERIPPLRGVGRVPMAHQGLPEELQGRAYSIWDWASGVGAQSLDNLSTHQIASLLRDCAYALARLHAVELSHGDIKPANFIFDEGSNRAWLIDLGLTSEIDRRVPTGASPRYLDPSPSAQDGRTRDLYALGVSLIELLSAEARAAKLQPRLEDFKPKTASHELWRLAAHLTSPSPSQRPDATWVWREAARLSGAPDPATLPAPELPRHLYLNLKKQGFILRAREELERSSGSAPQPPSLDDEFPEENKSATKGAAPLFEAWATNIWPRLLQIEQLARPGTIDAAEPSAASKPAPKALMLRGAPEPRASAHALTEAEHRAWLLQLFGLEAAQFPIHSFEEIGFVERIQELCERFPPASIGYVELKGEREPLSPPTTLQGLALALGGRPGAHLLEAAEALLLKEEAEPELSIALAKALRRRGELPRACIVLERLGQANALAELAETQRRLGNYPQSIALAERCLKSAPSPGAKALSRAQATLARSHLALGQIAEAKAALLNAKTSAEVVEAKALLALYQLPGDPSQYNHIENMLHLGASLADNDEERARFAGLRGQLAHYRNETEVATSAFSQASEWASQAGAFIEEATYLTGLAASACDAGLTERALHAAERAAAIFRRLGYLERSGRAELNQAAAWLACGALPEAASHASRAQELAERAQDPLCAGYALICRMESILSNAPAARPAAEPSETRPLSSSYIPLLEAATRRLTPLCPADELLLATQELRAALLDAANPIGSSPLLARLGALDELARQTELPAGVRVAWWGARAEAFLELGVQPELGRADEVLRQIIAASMNPAPLAQAGPAYVAAARLASQLDQGDTARQLIIQAEQITRVMRGAAPEAYRERFAEQPWVQQLEALVQLKLGVPAQALQELNAAQLAKLEQIVRNLSLAQPLGALLNQVLDALILWTGVERGLLLLRAPGDELKVRAARHLARERLSPHEQRLSMTLAKRALSARQPVVAVDAHGELPELHESVHALHLRSVLAVPLIARGEALGVVYLDDRDRRGAFGEPELAWVRLLSSILAVAITEAKAQLLLKRAATRAERASRQLTRSLARQNAELVSAKRVLAEHGHSELIGASPKLHRLIQLASRVAETALPVLITGESGTGKELIARLIHRESPRRERPFVAENCAAIPDSLLESILFGHMRGAFTGAERTHIGLFQRAHLGSLFLDEIGEMSLSMQAKLLRVLERGEVRPVGAEGTQPVDVRVIAATHRDLRELVRQGKFREDLFYRLEVFTLKVPALRDRREDIRLLAEHFISLYSSDGSSREAPRLSLEAARALESYHFPGNIRQLQNIIRKALVLAHDTILPSHFPEEIYQTEALPSLGELNLKRAEEQLQKQLVARALAECAGNQTQAARRLGISRFGLQKMLKRWETQSAVNITEQAEGS